MSSKTTFSLVFYINRTKDKKERECPVMLRININGEKVALRLKRFILFQRKINNATEPRTPLKSD